MPRTQRVSQTKLADYVSWSGFFTGLASIIPIYTQNQATPGFWLLAALGLSIILFGLSIRLSDTLFALVSGIIDGPPTTIGPCLDHQIDEVYALAREFFGHEVTEPTKIREIRGKYRSGLQVVSRRDHGRLVVRGYYFMFPINKRCVDKIVALDFDVSELAATDIAPQPRYGYAMYIGAIAGQGMMVRRELLGAIKMSGNLVAQTKTRTAYARAATARGRTLLLNYGFAPVHPDLDDVGRFYHRTFER